MSSVLKLMMMMMMMMTVRARASSSPTDFDELQSDYIGVVADEVAQLFIG